MTNINDDGSTPLPWQVGQIDLIAFRVDPQAAFNEDWLSELTGEDVESVRKKNERTDSCVFNGRSLRCASDILRTTWSLIPRFEVDVGAGFTGIPVLGGIRETFDLFVPLMEKWLDNRSPEVTRLALNARLYEVGATREENYAALGKYLHSVKVDPRSQELQYRINRPRKSKFIADLTLNRLSTWSAIQMTAVVRVGGTPVSDTATSRIVESNFLACMLQLDINTSHDRSTPLPPDQLVSIWHELVNQAWEIAEVGDVS